MSEKDSFLSLSSTSQTGKETMECVCWEEDEMRPFILDVHGSDSHGHLGSHEQCSCLQSFFLFKMLM